MKKILVLLMLFFVGLSASADFVELETNVNMANFWEKYAKETQKVTEVGSKLINANKLDKRIPIKLERNLNVVNAFSDKIDKTVRIYTGTLRYIDNDDELASILGHEMAHSLDNYDGLFKWIDMSFNSKEYEFKADLIGIDLMVKAGYNPIAAITCMNKWMGEDYWDFGVFTTHPKTSRRLLEMYKYIYRKYPWALKTEMVHNVNYENFTYSAQKEINLFEQKEKERATQQNREAL